VDAPPPPSRRTKRALESPEERAARARPANWTPPGPSPVGGDPVLQPGETLSFLSGDWRIFQLADGHRWSIDDHVTAMVALQEARRLRRAQGAAAAPLRTLDLGCGIGSVLLMTAWGLLLQQEEEQAATAPPTSRCLCCVGLEAQAVSAALARRSVEYNLGSSAANSGVTVIEGDLRDREVRAAAIAAAASAAAGAGAAAPLFELITGTPPYIPPGSGALSNRPQKGACCVETRGGVEEYCAAAAELLAAPEGGSDRSVFVCCAGVTPDDTRARRAAQEAGLSVRRRVVVVPRRGKPPLFEVLVMEKRGGGGGGGAGGAARDDPGAASAAAAAIEDEVFVVREADGSLAADMHAARAALGMPPAKGAPAKV
jgi:tRNA1(Val) A37 N6-methylase TrmN6